MSNFNTLFAIKMRANVAGIKQDMLHASLTNPDQSYNSAMKWRYSYDIDAIKNATLLDTDKTLRTAATIEMFKSLKTNGVFTYEPK